MTTDAGIMATQEFLLRAMAQNYAGGHSWDHLDGEACTKAADEIKALRARIAASQPGREAVARAKGHADRIRWCLANNAETLDFACEMVRKAKSIMDSIDALLSVQVDGEQKITADNERLLSCPFCGPGNSQVDTWHDDVSKRWRVGCGRCGSSSGASVHREGSKEAAIKSWNTRNGSPPVAETKPSPSSTSATATETALRAAKRLCDNINEFGHVTDAEIFDATETAIQKALETINVA